MFIQSSRTTLNEIESIYHNSTSERDFMMNCSKSPSVEISTMIRHDLEIIFLLLSRIYYRGD